MQSSQAAPYKPYMTSPSRSRELFPEIKLPQPEAGPALLRLQGFSQHLDRYVALQSAHSVRYALLAE